MFSSHGRLSHSDLVLWASSRFRCGEISDAPDLARHHRDAPECTVQGLNRPASKTCRRADGHLRS
jgi:hypothetical protein